MGLSDKESLKSMMDRVKNGPTGFDVEPLSKIHRENEVNTEKKEESFIILPTTPFREVFEKYPFLTDKIYSIHPNFKKLKSPLMMAVIPFADVSKVCEKTGVPFQVFTRGVEKLLAEHGL